MGTAKTCFFCHRKRKLIISLLLLMVSSLTLVRFTAEGRPISNLLEDAQKGEVEEGKVMVRREVIGSRPPSCERRCNSCGHCEAVQVPVTTLVQSRKRGHFSAAAAIANVAYSRGDDISNYKPMSWKCKCGNFFFNP